MTFNAQKTVYMIFTNKIDKTKRYPAIIFNGNVIEKVSNHMHLGITLNETLSWDNHINQLIKRTTGPLVDCQLICNKHDRLESIQRKAIIACTAACACTSHNKLLKDVGLEPLMLRRKCFRLFNFCKIVHDQAPQYLVTLCPSVGSTTTYNLRNANNISTIKNKLKECSKSFFPKQWKTGTC